MGSPAAGKRHAAHHGNHDARQHAGVAQAEKGRADVADEAKPAKSCDEAADRIDRYLYQLDMCAGEQRHSGVSAGAEDLSAPGGGR